MIKPVIYPVYVQSKGVTAVIFASAVSLLHTNRSTLIKTVTLDKDELTQKMRLSSRRIVLDVKIPQSILSGGCEEIEKRF